MSHFFPRLSSRLLLGLALAFPILASAATPAPTAELLSPQAVPTVTSFNPTSGVVGSTVNVVGSGFLTATSVTFNNTPAAFSVIDDLHLSATVPAGASSGRIRVINADGTGKSATNFTVTLPPAVSGLNPSSGAVGASVNVNGQRLGSASAVTLNSVPVAFTQVSTTRVSFVVPGGATSGFVTVTTPDGTATSPNQFTVLPNPPTISSFTPLSGAGGVTSVSITGTNFINVNEVRFGTTSASMYTVNSTTSITATVPAGASTGRIRVLTAGGTAVSATNFTVAGVPNITSFTPTTTGVGGTVIIRGTGFVNVSAVRVNGMPFASFVVNSTKRITAIVSAMNTTGLITVVSPSGTGSSSALMIPNLTINTSAPTITSFNFGSRTVGQSLQINGTNFVPTVTVTFTDNINAPAAGVVINAARTRITVNVPAGAVTGRVRVTNNNGTAESPVNLIVTPDSPPTITNLAIGPPQRQCANALLSVFYNVSDLQTPATDLVVTGSSPGDGSIIVFSVENPNTNPGSGPGDRIVFISAVNTTAGGSTTLTLTVTDGAGNTTPVTFPVIFDQVVTANAGSDQNVPANQPVAVSGTATGASSTLWTSTGSGFFDNPAAASTNYNPSQADYLAGSVVLTFTATGVACPTSGDAATIAFYRTDRVVSSPETLTGVYNNVLIAPGGVATVNGPLDVATSFEVQTGTSLLFSGSCQPATGTGTFNLEDGATLGICHPDGIAASGAFGQIELAGLRTFGAGANYLYSGSGIQGTGTALPFNLTGSVTINNGGAGVDLNSDLNLRGILHLLNGDLRLHPEQGFFTVISNAAGTGVVDNQSGAVVGMATVQRYIDGAAPAVGYRHLSSPVQATTVSDLTTSGFTAVANSAFNALLNPVGVRPYPNVFGYDEQRFPTKSNFQLGYFSPMGSSAQATNAVLEPGRGYSVFLKGGLTPDFNGTLTTGTVTRTGLTHTSSFDGPMEKSGWHLLGNPYPSPIDWDLVTIPAGMSPSVFVWRSMGSLGGMYVPYVNGSGTPGTQLIGLGQGIFVRVTGAGPVAFSFTNACRVTTLTNVPVYRAARTRSQLALSLRGTTAPAATATEAYVYFQDGATAGYDVAFDAPRPDRNIGVPTLATLAADEELAVNALAPEALTAGARLPLLVDVPAAGTYELAVRELTNLADGDVYLLDALTGTAQRLSATSRYTFTANAAGEQSARFALRFGAATATAEVLTVWPNPATGLAQVRLSNPAQQLTLVDALGRTVRTLALTAGQTDATLSLMGVPAGVYTVRAGATTTRLVVE